MEWFRISDRLQFGVHLANGNLWIDHRDLTVRGTGLDMTLRTSYGYLDAWHLNAGEAMSMDLSFSDEVFVPMDGGACAIFPINDDGSYGMARNGVRANLVKNSGGITDQSGTSNWTYSSTNQLTSAVLGQTTQLSADHDTIDQTQVRRITENTAGVSTEHIFTHTTLGISTVKVNGTRTSVARDPEGTLVTQQKGSTRHNLITDHQGTVVATMTTTGTLATTPSRIPYGQPTTSTTPASPFGFHGGYTLNNGLIIFGYRYYNPFLGRFTAPTPPVKNAMTTPTPLPTHQPRGPDRSERHLQLARERGKHRFPRRNAVGRRYGVDRVCYFQERIGD